MVQKGCEEVIIMAWWFLSSIPIFSYLFLHVVIHRLQRISVLPWSTLSSDFGVLSTVSYFFSLSFILHWAFFFPFLNIFSQKCHHLFMGM